MSDDRVRYLPVTVEGRTACYLYVSSGSDRLGTLDASGQLDPEFVRDAARHWQRMAVAYRDRGLGPEQALEHARREPETELGGRVPQGAVIAEAEDFSRLFSIAQPDHDPNSPYRQAVWDTMHVQRPHFTPLVSVPMWEIYAPNSQDTVRCLPVRVGDEVAGFVWAALHEEAAGFVRRVSAHPECDIAEGWWLREIRRLHMHGYSALEALRARVGLPEHPKGGRIEAGEPESQVEGSQGVRDLAQAE